MPPEGDPMVALRRQQALELLAPLLQKAMRPLLDEQTELLDELHCRLGQQHEDGLQRCLNLIIDLLEQQEQQQATTQQFQLAALQHQEDLLRQILDALAALKDAHGAASGGLGVSAQGSSPASALQGLPEGAAHNAHGTANGGVSASACRVPPEGVALQMPGSAAEAPTSVGCSTAPGPGAAGTAARQQEGREGSSSVPRQMQTQMQPPPPPQQQQQQQRVQAPQQPMDRRVPRSRPGAVGLLDHVRVTASDNSSMPPGTLGVVLGSDTTEGRRLRVWALGDSWEYGTFGPDALEIVDRADVPFYCGSVQYLPYDPERRQGVPVTRFTAAPGMLVRRGYDGLVAGESDAADAAEIGVICPSHDLGDTCEVEWPHGYRKKYDTGRANRFELVHLEVSPTSGAPVVAGDCWASTTGSTYRQQRGQTGEVMQRPSHLVQPTDDLTPVERGTHWLYDEPGAATAGQMGTRDCKLEQAKAGCVAVSLSDCWTTVRRRASPAHGYDLCYSARTWDPVTLLTARQGMRARIDHYWGAVVLVRPLEVRGDGVMWQLSLLPEDQDEEDKVLVGATQCDPVMWVIK